MAMMRSRYGAPNKRSGLFQWRGLGLITIIVLFQLAWAIELTPDSQGESPGGKLFNISSDVSETNKTEDNQSSIKQINTETSNGTSQVEAKNDFDEEESPSFAIVSSLFYRLMFMDKAISLFGLLSNLCVILLIIKSGFGKRVNDVFILSLSIANVTFLLQTMMFATYLDTEQQWISRITLCKLIKASDHLFKYGSSFSIVAMAFNGFMVVCHPNIAQRVPQPRIARLTTVLIWLFALMMASPLLYLSTIHEKTDACHTDWPEFYGFDLKRCLTNLEFLATYLGPAILICAFTFKINAVSNQLKDVNSDLDRQESISRLKRFVSTIAGIYLFCWLPHWVMTYYISFEELKQISLGCFVLIELTVTFAFLNSCLDPIIYAFMSPTFEDQLEQIWSSVKARLRSGKITSDLEKEISSKDTTPLVLSTDSLATLDEPSMQIQFILSSKNSSTIIKNGNMQ